MTAHLQRALLLIEKSRFELAERELRRVLATDPNDPVAHCLLAICFGCRQQFKAAIEEATKAVALAPDVSFPHYVLAGLLADSNRLREAESAIREAIRLDPTDPDCYNRLARIHFERGRWEQALHAAQQGLQFDPEHVGCANLRAMSLVKLGAKDQAGAALEATLARNPESALTHTNLGWQNLEVGNHRKALEHFREALRIDPQFEPARHGIIESLKARYFIYRLMLSYFLWMAKLSRGAQWGVIIGGYIGYRILREVARSVPEVRPWVIPLLVLYAGFALMTWMAEPLFDLLLRLNRFGRLVLTREETTTSNWVGLCVAGALAGAIAILLIDMFGGLITVLTCVLMIPPVTTIYRCSPGWPRRTAVIVTVVLLVLALTSQSLVWTACFLDEQSAALPGGLGLLALAVFVFGSLIYQFAANALMAVRPRR